MAKSATSEPEAEGEEGAAKPKGGLSKKKLMILGGVGLLVVAAFGLGGYHFLAGGKKEEKPAVAAVKPPAFLDLPDVLVNLANTGSERTQYLKVKVVLELPDQTLAQQIQPVLPRVMDTFQIFLRELRASDLDGSAGMYRLREELTRRVNVAIAPNRVNAVLFKEIIVQ